LHGTASVESASSPDIATRVLVLHDADPGRPDWLPELTRALDRFGLKVGTRALSDVSSIAGLLRGHRFCVFVLVEGSRRGPERRLQWQAAFEQVAASTQLLRVVDEHAIGDVLADAVLSDVERIASRLRRQRASTVTPAGGVAAVRRDFDE
jgi:hypothetical protein